MAYTTAEKLSTVMNKNWEVKFARSAEFYDMLLKSENSLRICGIHWSLWEFLRLRVPHRLLWMLGNILLLISRLITDFHPCVWIWHIGLNLFKKKLWYISVRFFRLSFTNEEIFALSFSTSNSIMSKQVIYSINLALNIANILSKWKICVVNLVWSMKNLRLI